MRSTISTGTSGFNTALVSRSISYTALEHNDLLRRLGLVIDMVFDRVQQANAHDPSWNNMTASIELGGTGQRKREVIKEWKAFLDRTINDDDKKVFQVGRHRLKGLIRYLLTTSTLRLVVVFTPTIWYADGRELFPFLPNFYLFHCEYEHVMALRLTDAPTINAAAYCELEHMAVAS